MGIDYKIDNLTKGNYDIMLYEKEYNKGIFKQEHALFDTALDSFKYAESGVALSILDEIKSIELDKEIPVYVYSIGKLGETTESVSINEDKYDIKPDKNETDLVVFIKMTKL